VISGGHGNGYTMIASLTNRGDWGNGMGRFDQGILVPMQLGSSSAPGIVAGDWNLDGKADVAASQGNANKVSVFPAPGWSPIDYGVGVAPSMVQTAHLNNDGKLDLAVLATGDKAITVLLNTSQ